MIENENTPEVTAERDIDRINAALAHYGLYSIEGDFYPTTQHDDESWPLKDVL